MVLSVSRKATTISGLLLLLIALALAAEPHLPPMRDFDQTFYPAIRYLLAGENPYTGAYQETGQGAPPAFFSPAWLLLILLPVGLFPPAIARALWMLFLIGITFAGIAQLRWWGLKGVWPLVLAVLPWSLIGILFGQVTAIVFFGAMIALTEAAKPIRNHRSAFIILLGLILMNTKPQLGIFIALPLALWLLWQRDRRLLTIAAGGTIVFGAVLMVTPLWLIQSAIETQKMTVPLWMSTVERELHLWGLPAWIAWFVRVAVIAVMGLWAWRTRTLTPAWWSAWLAAVLIITPYTRAYDGVLLLPILGLLVAQYRLRALVFLVVVVLYAAISELGTVVTPLVAWLLFVPWQRLVTSGEI